MCKQTISSLSGSYLFQLHVLHVKLQKTKEQSINASVSTTCDLSKG